MDIPKIKAKLINFSANISHKYKLFLLDFLNL